MKRIRSVARRLLRRDCLEDYTREQRLELWLPRARPLESRHIQNCRLVENRVKMLEYMPSNSVCAELGVFLGDYSAEILSLTQPARLHLIDIDSTAIKIAEKRFSQQISDGIVELHRGDSAKIVQLMPDNYFDWVYVDADHSYEGVKRDLGAVRPKLKTGGMIALNDYIFFDFVGFVKFGVIEAVNEFCFEYDFELLYFALQDAMYSDVVIRKTE